MSALAAAAAAGLVRFALVMLAVMLAMNIVMILTGHAHTSPLTAIFSALPFSVLVSRLLGGAR
jgi:hypothetical protein